MLIVLFPKMACACDTPKWKSFSDDRVYSLLNVSTLSLGLQEEVIREASGDRIADVNGKLVCPF